LLNEGYELFKLVGSREPTMVPSLPSWGARSGPTRNSLGLRERRRSDAEDSCDKPRTKLTQCAWTRFAARC
jgi:hypothetical protein